VYPVDPSRVETGAAADVAVADAHRAEQQACGRERGESAGRRRIAQRRQAFGYELEAAVPAHRLGLPARHQKVHDGEEQARRDQSRADVPVPAPQCRVHDEAAKESLFE
jgi:hypothetical protein